MLKLLAFALIFFNGPILSQTLHPEAVKIKTAFEKLSLDTGNRKLQKKFVANFPSDAQTFLNIFNPERFDQLYNDSYKYLESLERCARSLPAEVMGKCIDIGKDLVWDADAVSHFQQLLVKLSESYLKPFLRKFGTLTTQEQDRLISFYADAENHKAYPIYQELIDRLKANGQTDIGTRLELARTTRQNTPGH